jgi:hypothetical protein
MKMRETMDLLETMADGHAVTEQEARLLWLIQHDQQLGPQGAEHITDFVRRGLIILRPFLTEAGLDALETQREKLGLG